MYGTFLYEGKTYRIFDAKNFQGFQTEDYFSEKDKPFIEMDMCVTYKLNGKRVIVDKILCNNLFGTYPKINGVWPDCDEFGVQIVTAGCRSYSNIELEIYDTASILLVADEIKDHCFALPRLTNYSDVKELTIKDGNLVSVIDHSALIQDIREELCSNIEIQKWINSNGVILC